MTLNRNALGVSIGAVFAVCMFLTALTAAYLNWGVNIVNLMGDIYIGYEASFLGGIIGAIWAFVDGFIFGFLIAWVYNLVCKKCSKCCVEKTSQPQESSQV